MSGVVADADGWNRVVQSIHQPEPTVLSPWINPWAISSCVVEVRFEKWAEFWTTSPWLRTFSVVVSSREFPSVATTTVRHRKRPPQAPVRWRRRLSSFAGWQQHPGSSPRNQWQCSRPRCRRPETRANPHRSILSNQTDTDWPTPRVRIPQSFVGPSLAVSHSKATKRRHQQRHKFPPKRKMESRRPEALVLETSQWPESPAWKTRTPPKVKPARCDSCGRLPSEWLARMSFQFNERSGFSVLLVRGRNHKVLHDRLLGRYRESDLKGIARNPCQCRIGSPRDEAK